VELAVDFDEGRPSHAVPPVSNWRSSPPSPHSPHTVQALGRKFVVAVARQIGVGAVLGHSEPHGRLDVDPVRVAAVRTTQIKEVAHGEISSTWIPSMPESSKLNTSCSAFSAHSRRASVSAAWASGASMVASCASHSITVTRKRLTEGVLIGTAFLCALGLEMHASQAERAVDGIKTFIEISGQMQQIGDEVGDFT